MSDLSLSDLMTEEELIDEVRTALAGLDHAKIPDDTIVQAANRFVLPILNEVTSDSVDEDKFENAFIFWTAEKSFDAWLAFERLRDAELETFTRPDRYRERLEKRTNVAIQQVDASRPSEHRNVSITVKHDGVTERIDLDGRWTP